MKHFFSDNFNGFVDGLIIFEVNGENLKITVGFFALKYPLGEVKTLKYDVKFSSLGKVENFHYFEVHMEYVLNYDY